MHMAGLDRTVSEMVDEYVAANPDERIGIAASMAMLLEMNDVDVCTILARVADEACLP